MTMNPLVRVIAPKRARIGRSTSRNWIVTLGDSTLIVRGYSGCFRLHLSKPVTKHGRVVSHEPVDLESSLIEFKELSAALEYASMALSGGAK